MTFDEYQDKSAATVEYPIMGHNVIYPALGLAGESGELVDKIKKHWRNYSAKAKVAKLDYMLTGMAFESYSDGKELADIEAEIGDVLWYLAAICRELRLDLGTAAERNLKKLLDRQQRDVICSQGDNR